MKVKSKSFITDCQKIKSMPRGNERRALAEYFANKYNCSYVTIMREANKKTSKIGIRKKRSDANVLKVKPTAKEIKMLDELVKSGHTKKEAVKIMEKERNKKISSRTKDKLSKSLQQKLRNKPDSSGENKKSNFGSEAKRFIEEVWQLDKIAPGRQVKIKIAGGHSVNLSRDAIDHIKAVVAAEVNLQEFKEEKKVPYDGDMLLRAVAKTMLTEMMFYARQQNDLDALGQISLILQRLDIATDIKACNPNFKTMFKILQEFKKDITIDEAIALIEKYEPKI